jgi:elongation factor Ts
MAEITAQLVQELREATNVGMMECKKALVEAKGDKAQAIKILRERGMAVAAKKSTRAANQGLIAAAQADGGRSAALIEVNCETDFVARNANFKAFVAQLAQKAAALDGTLAESMRAEIAAKIAEIGENIVARRNLRFSLQGEGLLGTYIHLGDKVGVLIEVGCGKAETAANALVKELARDLTLHIAACSPRYLARQDVPADVIAAEREIYAKQVQNKPPQIVEKIVDGKMNKFYGQVCLLEQLFVRDQETPVNKLLAAKGKEVGDTLTIRRFARYQLGE